MKRLLLSLACTLGLATIAAPALADKQTLEGGCEFQGGADCTASCSGDLTVYCDVQLAAQCTGSCNVKPPSCDVKCSGGCTAACNADPGNFTCEGHCGADCQGTCDAHCSASTDGATSQADCKAKCQSSCKAQCEGECKGTPPNATCDAKCSASCTGECDAETNISCNVKCQAAGSAKCQADAKAQCTGNCSAHGVVVCNGVVQELVDDAKAAADWISHHVTYSASAEAHCSGNTCEASANAQAKSSCAASPIGSDHGEASFAVLFGAVALTGARSIRRKRR